MTLKAFPPVEWHTRIATLGTEHEEILAAALLEVGLDSTPEFVAESSRRRALIVVLGLVGSDISGVLDPSRRLRLRRALLQEAATFQVPWKALLQVVAHSSAIESFLTAVIE